MTTRKRGGAVRKSVAQVSTADARVETTNADDWRLGRAVPVDPEAKPADEKTADTDTPETSDSEES